MILGSYIKYDIDCDGAHCRPSIALAFMSLNTCLWTIDSAMVFIGKDWDNNLKLSPA